MWKIVRGIYLFIARLSNMNIILREISVFTWKQPKLRWPGWRHRKASDHLLAQRIRSKCFPYLPSDFQLVQDTILKLKWQLTLEVYNCLAWAERRFPFGVVDAHVVHKVQQTNKQTNTIHRFTNEYLRWSIRCEFCWITSLNVIFSLQVSISNSRNCPL